jgi:MFS family permease
MIAALAIAVAVVAALRSTWSPCGQSMLSTITPIAERGRGHRFAATAAWFTIGSVLGGATLGVALTAGAAAFGSLTVSTSAAAGLVAVVAAITFASDAGRVGFRLPAHRRQVNEMWLDAYRPWLYASGFGWQIGTGVATYITTSAVYLFMALAILSASPAAAIAAGLTFGLVRGLAVFLSVRVTSPAALLALHRRFEALRRPSHVSTLVAQGTVAFIAATAVTPVLGVGLIVVAAVAGRVARSEDRVDRLSEVFVARADLPDVVGGQVDGHLVPRV